MSGDEQSRIERPAPADRDSRWTGIDIYLGGLARRRTARRQREGLGVRTEPESPRATLGLIPFLTLMGGLALLTIAIVIAAWPGRDYRRAPAAVDNGVSGTAEPGWFDEAKREFR